MRLIVIVIFLLPAGCVLTPDQLGAGIRHDSDPSQSNQMEYAVNSAEAWARWLVEERGYIEMGCAYHITKTMASPGSKTCTIRGGVYIRIKE